MSFSSGDLLKFTPQKSAGCDFEADEDFEKPQGRGALAGVEFCQFGERRDERLRRLQLSDISLDDARVERGFRLPFLGVSAPFAAVSVAVAVLLVVIVAAAAILIIAVVVVIGVGRVGRLRRWARLRGRT